MMLSATDPAEQVWPALPLEQWKDTYVTLHMWTQIVGKIRLALTPLINHWWNVPLYVNARGLTTSLIPYRDTPFELLFDLVSHQLVFTSTNGKQHTIPLAPMTVADFYKQVMGMLRAAEINVKIWPMPVEVPDPIRCDEDHVHSAYDPEAAHRFWRVLLAVHCAFEEFRSRFLGKCSPVHFFWGSFDLAVTRFSGRQAPERSDADRVTREAYSHEVSSVGFWPGSGNINESAFYSYTAPEPPGFRDWRVRPAAARYDTQAGEFILMYDDVRRSASPREMLLDFCQSTYEAGATLAKWDRELLERRAETTVKNTA